MKTAATRFKTKRDRFVGLVSAMALVLIVSGCGYPTSEPVTEAEVYGTWISRGPAGQTATFVFAEDGSFQGTDLPGDVFRPYVTETYPGAADWDHRTERHGTWSIKWDKTIHWADVVLNTQFTSGEILTVFGSESEKTLSAFIGDGDSWVRLIFERADRPVLDTPSTKG